MLNPLRAAGPPSGGIPTLTPADYDNGPAPSGPPRPSMGMAPFREMGGVAFVGDWGGVNPGLVDVPVPGAVPAPAPVAPRPAAPEQSWEDLRSLDAIYMRQNPLALPAWAETTTPDSTTLRAVLARVAPADAARLAAQAQIQVEGLSGSIDAEYSHARGARDVAGDPRPSPGWPARIFPLVERRARLRAVQAVLQASAEGKTLRYAGSSRAAIEGEFGEVVIGLHLSSHPVERLPELHDAAARRRDRLAELAAEAEGYRARPFAHRIVDVEDAVAGAVGAEVSASALAAELAEANRALSAIGPALAELVSSAVNSAGGAKEVTAGLVEARLMSPDLRVPVHLESGELRQVESQLGSLGASPESAGGGKIVLGLQARHRELSEAIARRKADDRKAGETEAVRTVERALKGYLSAYEGLASAVRGQPLAFADGFASSLEALPLRAVRSAGCRPFASAVGFWI